jgi:hypothetical protein
MKTVHDAVEAASSLGDATAKSYVIPLVCFIVITAYALFCKAAKVEDLMAEEA